MEQDSQTFERRIDALFREVHAVADDLAAATERLRSEGIPLPESLQERLASVEQQIAAVCTELKVSLRRIARGASTPDIEPSLKFALQQLKQLRDAEKDTAHTRSLALAVLQQSLTIVHIDRPDFPPLVACQEEARRYIAEISEASEPLDVTHELANGKHPIAALVMLLTEGTQLDYARYDELLNVVFEQLGQAFGTPLARGSLRFQRDTPLGAGPTAKADVVSLSSSDATPPSAAADAMTEMADDAADTANARGLAYISETEGQNEPLAHVTAESTGADRAREALIGKLSVLPEDWPDSDPRDEPGAQIEPAGPFGASVPAQATSDVSQLLAESAIDNLITDSSLPWITALLIEDTQDEHQESARVDESGGDLQERAIECLAQWITEYERLPYAYLVGRWLQNSASERALALCPPEFYEVAAYAFSPEPSDKHYPGVDQLYTRLIEDPPTSVNVSAWYLAAALALLRNEASGKDLLDFDMWMQDEQWELWARLGRALLIYIRQDGQPLSEIERRLNNSVSSNDPELERKAALEILTSITGAGYFDFKKGQRLSLIMHRELDWLRHSLQESHPPTKALEWAKTMRADRQVERQIDRWADEAEPRTVPLSGRRRQALLRDLQALRSHILSWEAAITQQAADQNNQTTLHALYGLADVVRQERDGWQRAWAEAGQPMITAWCSMLLQRLNPILERIDWKQNPEVAP